MPETKKGTKSSPRRGRKPRAAPEAKPVQAQTVSEAKALTITPVAAAPQLVHIDMNTLMLEAVKNPQSMEALERLVALRLQLEQEAARKSYFSALSAFQRECPTIPKSRIVLNRDGSVRYRYAPIEVITERVREPLGRNGLSFTLDIKQEESSVTGIFVGHHVDGHEERTSITVPVMPENMNRSQAVISARTYAVRMALTNGLGIAPSEDDDDALSSGPVEEKRSAAAGGRKQNTAPRGSNTITVPKDYEPEEKPKEAIEVQGTVQDAPPPAQEPQTAKRAERITKDDEGNEITEAQVEAVAQKCRAGVTMLNKAKLNGNQVLADADLAPTIRRIKQMEEAMEYDNLKSTYVDLRKLWDDYNAKKGETHG